MGDHAGALDVELAKDCGYVSHCPNVIPRPPGWKRKIASFPPHLNLAQVGALEPSPIRQLDGGERQYSFPYPPLELPLLKGEKLEVWQTLCAQAAVEQGPEKLVELVREINRLLGEKEDRRTRAPNDGYKT